MSLGQRGYCNAQGALAPGPELRGTAAGQVLKMHFFVWPAVLFYICQHLKIENFNIKPQILRFLGTFLHGICQPNLNSSFHSPHHSNFFFSVGPLFTPFYCQPGPCDFYACRPYPTPRPDPEWVQGAYVLCR